MSRWLSGAVAGSRTQAAPGIAWNSARQRPSTANGTVSTRSPGSKPGQRDSTTSPTLSCPG